MAVGFYMCLEPSDVHHTYKYTICIMYRYSATNAYARASLWIAKLAIEEVNGLCRGPFKVVKIRCQTQVDNIILFFVSKVIIFNTRRIEV